MSRHHENLNHQLVAAYIHLSSGAQSCTYHFHLMMDCCHPHQSLWPGGSCSIQLMMSSSLYIVTLWAQSIIQGPVYRKMVFCRKEYDLFQNPSVCMIIHHQGPVKAPFTISVTDTSCSTEAAASYGTSGREAYIAVWNSSRACSLGSTKNQKSYKLLGKCVQATFMTKSDILCL